MKYKMMMLAGVLSASLQTFAQEIKGKIVDAANKEPLEFVNIALYKEGSDKMVKGITTDAHGNFSFDALSDGTYQLKISFVGYGSMNLPVAITKKKNDVNLGAITLKEDTKVLKEVQVTGQRSQMRFEVDKKIFNVDQNIASAGGSASDALSNIPSVTVDNEGNVSLRNNPSVTIWINGRPSGLSEDNRAQILEQLPAESIESVEIITNPSARFSSEGSAGIINIVMKKEKKMGYFGGVSANGDTQGGYGASTNINLNYDKWEGYASVGYRRREMKMSSESDRTSFSEDMETLLHQDGDGKGNGGGLFGRLGATYNFSKKDAISFSGSVMDGSHDRNNLIDYSRSTNGGDSYLYSRDTRSENDHLMLQGSIDYSHTFAKDHDLKISASYDYMDRKGTSHYTQINGDNVSYQLQDDPRIRKGFEAQIDYAYKINDAVKIEAGYKGNINSHKTDARTWNSNERIPELEEESLYNIFKYDENIQALYASAAGKFGKFSYQAGLRGEYTWYDTKSTGMIAGVETPESKSKSYFDLFPSLFLSYSLPKENELQINYTRRINRPRGRQLNSFANISDSANISFGNPLLDPEFSNSFEFNYIKNWEKHMLSASLYYRSTSDVIQRVSYLEGNTLYSTYDNATDSRRAGMELVGKNRLFDFLDLTTTVNMYYYKINGFDYRYGADQQYHYNGSEDFSWDARMIANVTLPWKLSLQLTGNYTSAVKTAQGKDFDSYWLDAGIRRAFLDRKLTVAVTARDLLDSRRTKSYTFGENFFQTSEMKWGGRQFGISVSYNFGNMKSSKKKPNSRNEESMGNDMMEF